MRIDPKYFRPTEVEVLVADATKSETVLGWKSAIRFKDLVKIIIDADMKVSGLDPAGESEEIIRKKFPHRWMGRVLWIPGY